MDYGDIAALALGIRTASVAHGPITLAVCYIHSDATMAPIVVADLLGMNSCRYIHVVGRMAPDELRVDANRDEIVAMPGIR